MHTVILAAMAVLALGGAADAYGRPGSGAGRQDRRHEMILERLWGASLGPAHNL